MNNNTLANSHVDGRVPQGMSRIARGVMLASTLLFATQLTVAAGFADLADTPISTARSYNAPPNIMVLMDTSESMAWGHMPDSLENVASAQTPIGYKSFQCNVLYFNPTLDYKLPKTADGSTQGDVDFTAASVDFYGDPTVKISLATDFQAFTQTTRKSKDSDAFDPKQSAYYYYYTGSQLNAEGRLPPTSPACQQLDVGSPNGVATISAIGGGTWNRILVSDTSSPSGLNGKRNFARWYTFYRTRLAMTKSGIGMAFSTLTDGYRVGLVTMDPYPIVAAPTAQDPGKLARSDRTTVDASQYVPLGTFTGTQREAWYNKLYSQRAVGASPAREGLARVGRHYGGQVDSINTGMAGDSMTEACQQNFTIMTTDGYWNTGAESKGPVKLDGVTWVGQQDGDLSNPLSPRPIYDGGRGGSRVTLDQNVTYGYEACAGGWFTKTTDQTKKTVIQVSQARKQQLQRQERVYQSSFQRLETSTEVTKTTTQVKQTQKQLYKRTFQALKSTVQDIRWTEQPQSTGNKQQKRTLQTLADTTQVFRTDTQTKAFVFYWKKETFQRLQTQTRDYQTVVQALQTDRRWYSNTTQFIETRTQIAQVTEQRQKRTYQMNERTSQLRRYDGATEQDVGVETCTSGGTVYCYTATTGPTPVTSCTAQTADAGNNWRNRTCTPNSDTGWVGVAAGSCTASAGTSANSFLTTECRDNNTPSTYVATCSAAPAGSGNSYVNTTCTTTTVSGYPKPSATLCGSSNGTTPDFIHVACTTDTTAKVAVATCTNIPKSLGNEYKQTICEDRQIVAVRGVVSCPGGYGSDGVTRYVCTSGNSGPTNVDTCVANPGTASPFRTVTCSTTTIGTANTPVATCAASLGSGLRTTCADNNTSIPQTASCTNVAKAGPNFVQTVCTQITVSNNGVQACADVTGSGADGNASNYTTQCVNANIAERAVASCANQTGGNSNNWLTIACRQNNATNTPVASCAVAAGTTPSFINTTKCTANNSAWADGACTPGVAVAPNWITTQCQTVSTGVVTNVQTCTAVDPATNGGTGNTCNIVKTPEVAVQTCTPSTATGSPWVSVFCRQNTTTNVPVASCAPIAESSPNWIETTCSNADTPWTAVAAGTCTSAIATAPNWITTECDDRTLVNNVAVQTCAPGTDGAFIRTTCDTSGSSANIPSASCAPQTAAAPDWIGITCATPAAVNYTNKPVASCTPQVPQFSNSYRTIDCTDNNVAEQPVTACVANAGTTSPFNRVVCRIETVTAEQGVPYNTCSPVGASNGNGFVATLCRKDDMADAPVQSCTPMSPTAPDYKEVICTDRGSGPDFVADGSCTTQPSNAGTSWKQVICNTNTVVGSALTQSCSTSAGSAGDGYLKVSCVQAEAKKITYSGVTSRVSTVISGTAAVGTATTANTPYGPLYYDNICYTNGAPAPAPILPALSSSTTRSPSTLSPLPPSNCDSGTAAWPCVITTLPAPGADDKGSQNSLADVAQYYYTTDLRPLMADKVPGLGSGPEADTASWQHMTTFAIGLGVSGQLKYTKDYRSASSGDFQDIRSGVRTDGTEANWPVWPAPPNLAIPATTLDGKGNYANLLSYEDPRSIDDFWHAAVNGRGRYLSVDDPDSVVKGLGEALLTIKSQSGAGAGAATSTLAPIAGDNMAYTATFTSREWSGELQAYEIDIVTSALKTTPRWSAKTKLNALVGNECDNRKIYIFRPAAATKLGNFSWNTKACDSDKLPTGSADTGLTAAEQAYFNAAAAGNLSQWPTLMTSSAPVDQRALVVGANLVNFVRGQRGHEGYTPDLDGTVDTSSASEVAQANKVYRQREAVLGDIVNSQPAYVKPPSQNYQDVGYESFRNANTTRPSMVYVGANDGMLHAFYAPKDVDTATEGREAWAYIPTVVMPSLYRLADADYALDSRHTYFVDGSPVAGDIYDSGASAWKTILVGGLNKGGKGYYALDVSDPSAPKGMWEFNLSTTCYDASNEATKGGDCNLGYTFGKPVISKLADGTWVVLVTSGYNNGTPSGDGVGYLYVINASTGKLVQRISTGAGNSSTPSNLRDINTYVANIALDNTALRVYGGDMNGNVWRFNINRTDADNLPAPTSSLLGVTKDRDGVRQPITTNIELAEINGNTMVFVGTGRMLGSTDLDNQDKQSVYGFKDPLTVTALPDAVYPDADLRAALKPLKMVQQAFRASVATGEIILDENTTEPTVEVTRRVIQCDTSVAQTGQCETSGGWVVDLPDIGERVNVDLKIALNTLAFASNVPETAVCSSGGYSWLNYIDLFTGNAVSTSIGGVVSTRLGVTTVGLGLLVSGSGKTSGLVTGSDGKPPKPYDIPTGTPGPTGRRISWREVTQ